MRILQYTVSKRKWKHNKFVLCIVYGCSASTDRIFITYERTAKTDIWYGARPSLRTELERLWQEGCSSRTVTSIWSGKKSSLYIHTTYINILIISIYIIYKYQNIQDIVRYIAYASTAYLYVTINIGSIIFMPCLHFTFVGFLFQDLLVMMTMKWTASPG